MPPATPSIEDDHEQLSRSLWAQFGMIISGERVTGTYAPSAADVAGLQDMLPVGWDSVAPLLVARRSNGKDLVSTYKIGACGNIRRLMAVSDPNGQPTDFVVLHDPDNR